MRGRRDWLIHRMDPPADEGRVPVPPPGVVPMTAARGDLADVIDDGSEHGDSTYTVDGRSTDWIAVPPIRRDGAQAPE